MEFWKVALVGVVQVGLVIVGQPVKALALGLQDASESRPAGNADFIDVEDLPCQVERPVAAFAEKLAVPRWGVGMWVNENLLFARGEPNRSQVRMRLDAVMEKQALNILGDDLQPNRTAYNRSGSLSDIRQAKHGGDLLALKNAADDRFAQNYPGAMGGVELVAGKRNLLAEENALGSSDDGQNGREQNQPESFVSNGISARPLPEGFARWTLYLFGWILLCGLLAVCLLLGRDNE